MHRGDGPRIRLQHLPLLDVATVPRVPDVARDKQYRQRVATLAHVGSMLLEQNIRPGIALKRFGIEPSLLLDEEAWLDRAWAATLLEGLAERMADPLLGVRLSAATPVADLGDWGSRVANSRTLGEAISVGVRELSRLHTGVQLSLVCQGSEARVILAFPDSLPVESRQYLETTLMMVHGVLALAVEPVRPLVCLPYDSADAAGLERLLGARLAFSSQLPQLIFPADALRLPLCASVMSGRGRAAPAHVAALGAMRILRDLILFERPTVQAVSSAMSMNVRSLQRHLSSWGTTFREMLDQHRQRMAPLYLGTGCTVTDAAFRLGYSDTAHFIRAFRRWTGRSPGQKPGAGPALPLQVSALPARATADARALG